MGVRTGMGNGYVINVMSDDRPGIVAGVSAAISDMGGNIESCSQTVLDGYFTLILTFTLPVQWEIPELMKNFAAAEGLHDCQFMIRTMKDLPRLPEKKNPNVFVITAFGPDRKSIVAAFSQYLAGKEINILDLYGNITADNSFVLISQVEVNPKSDVKNLQLDLEELGEELGFTVRLQHNNIFIATNQLRLDN
ncbi:MAG: ACT domain-containing protein [Planctomycetia bacterium]|nr:ACT domain-containing protein [Planctomycetia bacterium]